MNWRIKRYGLVSSTQEIALGLIAEGAEVGTVVLAESQSKGRGRYGRTWISPAGGLYVSVILPKDPLLAVRVAVSVADALRGCSVRAAIKWPNDLMVADRKIAGIIIDNREEYAVVGIGVNMENAPLSTSTCTSSECVRPVKRDRLLDSILEELSQSLPAYQLREMYVRLCTTIGKRVLVRNPYGDAHEAIVGTAIDVDQLGRLIVEVSGAKRMVASGSCTHLD